MITQARLQRSANGSNGPLGPRQADTPTSRRDQKQAHTAFYGSSGSPMSNRVWAVERDLHIISSNNEKLYFSIDNPDDSAQLLDTMYKRMLELEAKVEAIDASKTSENKELCKTMAQLEASKTSENNELRKTMAQLDASKTSEISELRREMAQLQASGGLVSLRGLIDNFLIFETTVKPDEATESSEVTAKPDETTRSSNSPSKRRRISVADPMVEKLKALPDPTTERLDGSLEASRGGRAFLYVRKTAATGKLPGGPTDMWTAFMEIGSASNAAAHAPITKADIFTICDHYVNHSDRFSDLQKSVINIVAKHALDMPMADFAKQDDAFKRTMVALASTHVDNPEKQTQFKDAVQQIFEPFA